jgi:aminomethyltransferase
MSNLRTPLYQWHVDHKARMVPFGGWDMPVQYSGVVAEHKIVRSAAGLFDISHMARLSFGGPDALTLLEKVFTNSVATMKDGQVRYGRGTDWCATRAGSSSTTSSCTAGPTGSRPW